MAIVYKCSHCGDTIGSLRERIVSTSMLGLDTLSAQDKKQMISYHPNGDMQIQTICENCEEALNEHPHYYEMDHFLQ